MQAVLAMTKTRTAMRASGKLGQAFSMVLAPHSTSRIAETVERQQLGSVPISCFLGGGAVQDFETDPLPDTRSG